MDLHLVYKGSQFHMKNEGEDTLFSYKSSKILWAIPQIEKKTFKYIKQYKYKYFWKKEKKKEIKYITKIHLKPLWDEIHNAK